MSLSALKVDQLTIGRVAYGRNITLATDEATNFHLDNPGCRARRDEGWKGRPRHRHRSVGEGGGLFFSPGQPAPLRWSAECSQLCLVVPRASLEPALEELLWRSIVRPLRFDFAMTLRGPVGRSLIDTLELAARELDEVHHHASAARKAPHRLAATRPRRRATSMSLTQVQTWVLSTLAVTTILHMSAGQVIAPVCSHRTDAKIGLLIMGY